MTSGLLAKEQNTGGEASGSSGLPTLSTVEQTKVYTLIGDNADAEEKLASIAKETKQKGKLTMDPMVEPSWWSKKYSTPTGEIVSLVGRSADMPSVVHRGVVEDFAMTWPTRQ